MTTSAELLAIRRALGLTQSRMARLVGIETGSYALQEQGKRRPRAAQLELMRRLLADHAARGWCPTCGSRLAVEAHGGVLLADVPRGGAGLRRGSAVGGR